MDYVLNPEMHRAHYFAGEKSLPKQLNNIRKWVKGQSDPLVDCVALNYDGEFGWTATVVSLI